MYLCFWAVLLRWLEFGFALKWLGVAGCEGLNILGRCLKARAVVLRTEPRFASLASQGGSIPIAECMALNDGGDADGVWSAEGCMALQGTK